MNDGRDSRVELTVFGRPVDGALKLSDCFVPLTRPIREPGFFVGLFGQHKIHAISDTIAAFPGLLSVDVSVILPRAVLKARRPDLDDFKATGMISTHHTKREVLDSLADNVRERLVSRGYPTSSLASIDWSSPADYLRDHGDLLGSILLTATPWTDLPMLIHPAGLETSPGMHSVGTVRRSAVEIASASVRVGATISVQIDI